MIKKLPSTQSDDVCSSVSIARVLVLFLAAFGFSHSAFSQLELLKDTNPSEEHSYNEYSSLTHGQGRMYFVVDGKELWKSNGTPESSIKLRAFKSIGNLTMAGTTLYFTADDGSSGVELWKSNGTVGNTVRVKDIMPGATGSSPHNLTSVNGILYFAAYHNAGGIELWKSDGTSAGTMMVKDIAQGNSNPRSMVAANGILYFTATTTTTGYELWKSDGTGANTVLVKDITSGKQSSDPQLPTLYNGKVYFTAYDPATGRELWVTDGTNAGTVRLKDVRPGSQSSTPRNLTVVKSELIFTAHDGVHGDELWKTNGTTEGTMLVKDMNPGGVGSNATNELKTQMRDFTSINGILYFIAAKGPKEYIYRSDGTAAGTFIIQEAIHFDSEVFQPEFTYMNGWLYFFNGIAYSEDQNLLRMPYNGTASQVSTVRIIGKPFSWDGAIPVRNEMIHFYNNLYFFGRFSFNDEETTYGGYEFMRSNGTYEGTVGVVDAFVSTNDQTPREMIRAGNYVYMYLYGVLSYSPPLYVTDGTSQGTVQLFESTTPVEWAVAGDQMYSVMGLNGDTDNWYLIRFKGTEKVILASGGSIYGEGDEWYSDELPTNLTAVGDLLYFNNGRGEVWKTDGTPQGTVRVYDMTNAALIQKVGNEVLFATGGTSMRLWKRTTTGKALVRDLGRTGLIFPKVVSGNVLYFAIGSSMDSHDYEIWRSDGTTSGTYRLVESYLNATSEWDHSRLWMLKTLNGQVLFSSGNTSGGTSLFRINGTTSIEKVADIPAVYSQTTTVNNHLLMFVGTEEITQVYGTDGTAEGTQLLTTIETPLFVDWLQSAVIGDVAYINGYILDNNYIWRTDGTSCGTYKIYPGTTENFGLIALGNDLIFGGKTNKTGNEPYIYRNINALQGIPPCVQESYSMTMAAGEREERKASDLAYPNPFTNSFTFRLDDESAQDVEVAIYTSYGMPVETIKNSKSNTSYDLGSAWPKGSYIMKVKSGDKTVTHQVIKK